MAQITKEEFTKKFKAFFPFGVHAISDKTDLDLIVLLGNVSDDKDELEVSLIVHPEKDVILQINSIEEVESEWFVTTPKQSWVWRKAPELKGRLLKKELDSYDV
jgi:hypothetical protein